MSNEEFQVEDRSLGIAILRSNLAQFTEMVNLLFQFPIEDLKTFEVNILEYMSTTEDYTMLTIYYKTITNFNKEPLAEALVENGRLVSERVAMRLMEEDNRPADINTEE